jgi:tripartite-type tricarboxylate transporter receptor subunit TctC
MRRLIKAALVLGAALALSAPGRAQHYPSKQVTIVVPYAPGGGVDRLARLVAEQLREAWSTPVIVENRPGANGSIGAEHVARSGPDGYILLYSPPGPLVVNKLLNPDLAYDPATFTPISLIATSPNVLVAHPKVGVESIQQLIAYAKANPDRLNYASPGNGGTPHLSAELFKAMAGVAMVHVPYRGTGPLMSDLIGGNVDLTFSELGNILQHVRAGRLRALAVGSERRNTALPEVPAMAEVLPGFASATWSGLVAPAGTPAAIVQRISSTLAQSFKRAEAAKRVLESSELEAVVSTPEEMMTQMRGERERWGRVIRAIGLRAN